MIKGEGEYPGIKRQYPLDIDGASSMVKEEVMSSHFERKRDVKAEDKGMMILKTEEVKEERRAGTRIKA